MALYKERKGGSIYSQGQKGVEIGENGNGGFTIKQPSRVERATQKLVSIGKIGAKKGVELFKETFSGQRAIELYGESRRGFVQVGKTQYSEFERAQARTRPQTFGVKKRAKKHGKKQRATADFEGSGVDRAFAPVNRGHVAASNDPNFYSLSLAKSSRLDPFERAYTFNETATVVPNSMNRPKLNPQEIQRVFKF